MINIDYADSNPDAITAIDMPSPSWFALRALEGFTSSDDLLSSGRIKGSGFKKELLESSLECWRCGGDIFHSVNNGYCAPYKPTPKFNDHWECKGSKKEHNNKPKVFCAACEAVSHAAYHPNFKLNALYTTDGAYQLTLDEDLISFLLNPPQPPYLFCMAENNSQHMCWLSRYTLDNKLIAITKGRLSGLVSREKAWRLSKQLESVLKLSNVIRETLGLVPLATPLLSGRKEINNISSTNLQISQTVINLTRDKENDSPDLKKNREKLGIMLSELNKQSFCYLTWYVATMFLKAILTNFKAKPISEWQKIKTPNIK